MPQEPMFWSVLSAVLLPLFVMSLLFGLAGVSPDIVVRSFSAIVLSLIEQAFALMHALLTALLRRGRYPR